MPPLRMDMLCSCAGPAKPIYIYGLCAYSRSESARISFRKEKRLDFGSRWRTTRIQDWRAGQLFGGSFRSKILDIGPVGRDTLCIICK